MKLWQVAACTSFMHGVDRSFSHFFVLFTQARFGITTSLNMKIAWAGEVMYQIDFLVHYAISSKCNFENLIKSQV